MSTLTLVEKTCTKCDETKPLSGFYRDRSNRDGHSSWCRTCHLANTRANQARRRAEDPDQFRLAKRLAVQAHRQRTGDARGKRYAAAKRAATNELIDAHREEFEARFQIKKHEAGLL